MKKLFLVLLLVCSSVVAQMVPYQAVNNQGQSFFRLYNNTPYYVGCYYRDVYNYITFSVAPGEFSFWYPVYGQYEWQCQ